MTLKSAPLPTGNRTHAPNLTITIEALSLAKQCWLDAVKALQRDGKHQTSIARVYAQRVKDAQRELDRLANRPAQLTE